MLTICLIFCFIACDNSENCTHSDTDDNGICDVINCDKEFTDGCDDHRDSDDNEECDICEKPYSDGSEDATKIIFIGNSYTYYGQTVLEKSQKVLTHKHYLTVTPKTKNESRVFKNGRPRSPFYS